MHSQSTASQALIAERGGDVVREVDSKMATLTDLDQMTQQTSALVEQSAAAAESLRVQAGRLTTVVSSFSTDH